MLVKVNSCTRFGIDCVGVVAEINISSRGMPFFDIIGLTSREIDESKHRIKNAIQNSAIEFPESRIVVNLAPADLPKEGSFFDFAIAAGILSYITEKPLPEKSLFFGELSMDGSLRFTHGAFLLGLYAKRFGFKKIFLPLENAESISVFSGIEVYPVSTIESLYSYLLGKADIKLYSSISHGIASPPLADRNDEEKSDSFAHERSQNDQLRDSFAHERSQNDFYYIAGQDSAKRAMEISAAGGHSAIMVGPPGVGKTMLAKAYQTILPSLSEPESIETTQIHSVVGRGFEILVTEPPFRSPHHTISYAGMIGGGSNPKPGEISLAHNGILFMDEFTEFPRNVLESLRQPMEDGEVTVSRIKYSFKFPCRFVLLAACNPCACGYYGSTVKKCACSPRQLDLFRKKLSGPIIDRIDLYINVNNVDSSSLGTMGVAGMAGAIGARSELNGTSATIKKRVGAAREIQKNRFKDTGLALNNEMTMREVEKFCVLGRDSQEILHKSVSKYRLSMRSYVRLLKVSRTISDLEGVGDIDARHVIEALLFKFKSSSSLRLGS